MKNQEWSSAKSKGKVNGVGNLKTGKSLEESLKRMGEEADKGHVGRLLEHDRSMEIMEVKMCSLRRHHTSVINLNH